MALLAFGLTNLGLLIAWRMDSTQGFHAIMNLLLIPIWLLSGAFFPSAGVPGWLAWTMKFNPLTYGLAAFRHSLYLDTTAKAFGEGHHLGTLYADYRSVLYPDVCGSNDYSFYSNGLDLLLKTKI